MNLLMMKIEISPFGVRIFSSFCFQVAALSLKRQSTGHELCMIQNLSTCRVVINQKSIYMIYRHDSRHTRKKLQIFRHQKLMLPSLGFEPGISQVTEWSYVQIPLETTFLSMSQKCLILPTVFWSGLSYLILSPVFPCFSFAVVDLSFIDFCWCSSRNFSYKKNLLRFMARVWEFSELVCQLNQAV